MRSGIGLGSNIGDRLANLRAARDHIRELPGVRDPIIASSVYESDAIGCEPNAGRFLNAVIEISHDLKAVDLLNGLQNIERFLGRPDNHPRNISRPIDLDLLYHGDEVHRMSGLQVPHRRIVERRFVLEPLCEIRPDLLLPGHSLTATEILAQLGNASFVVRFSSQW